MQKQETTGQKLEKRGKESQGNGSLRKKKVSGLYEKCNQKKNETSVKSTCKAHARVHLANKYKVSRGKTPKTGVFQTDNFCRSCN